MAATGRWALVGHTDPPVIRSLAEWALVTVEDGALAVEFRQVAY